MRFMVGRSILVGVALMAMLAVTPGVASAQINGQGSPLTSPANYPYGCDTRWRAGDIPNHLTMVPEDFYVLGGSTVHSDCTIFQTGATPATSHIVPNSGKVTVARIKSGSNPAPVSIATVRQFTGKRQSDGQLVTTCCQGISETPTVNLTPNAVTEIPVNLLVQSSPYDPQNPGVAGWRDWVVINVQSWNGTLPIYDNGSHPVAPLTNDPGGTWMFPQVDPNQHNLNAWIANGFEVLMNYDWVPTNATTPGDQTPPANPTCPNAAWTVGSARAAACTPAATPLAQVRSTKLKLKRGRIGVSVKCARTDNQACKGKVRLRTAAKKPVLLASKSLNISAGKTKTVSVSLSGKARKRLKGKRKIRVEIALSGQPVISSDVKFAR